MNTQFYFEKLEKSKKYKEFIKNNKDAYFCSGFFSIDKEGADNQTHLDFYSPSEKKLFSFNLTDGIKFEELETFDLRIPEKISLNTHIDFNEFEKIIEKEVEKQGIKTKIKKFLFSLQKLKNKEFLISTVFISNLGLVKINIDIKTKKIISFEKKSFMDFFKIMGKKKRK